MLDRLNYPPCQVTRALGFEASLIVDVALNLDSCGDFHCQLISDVAQVGNAVIVNSERAKHNEFETHDSPSDFTL